MEPQPDGLGQDSGPDSERPLTAVEAAKVAGVHERTLRRAIASGHLRATKRHNAFRIAPADLRAWLHDREADTGPDPEPEPTPGPSAPVELVDELRRLLDQERDERQQAQARVTELTGEMGYWRGQAEALQRQLAALPSGVSADDDAISADYREDAPVRPPDGSGREQPPQGPHTLDARPSWLSSAWRKLTGQS